MFASALVASMPACGGRAGSVDTAGQRGCMHVGNGRVGFARWRSCARRSRPLSRGGDGKRSRSRWSCCSSQRWWRPNRRGASQLLHDAHGRTAVRANENRRGRRGRGLPRRNGEWHLEQLTRSSQVLPAAGVGEQAVVANAVEAAGKDMQQEAADELIGAERHRFVAGLAFGAIVLVAKADPALIERKQPRIGDGDAVRVAGKVGEHCRRAGEGPLGVDHPFASAQRREPLYERRDICERRVLAEELQSACAVSLFEFFEEAATEQTRQHAYREKETGPAAHPALAVNGETAAGYDAVH